MMFGDKQVKCGDQNNPDIYKKPMIGKALCLPQTIGSTTGGMVLFTVCSHGKQPACMLLLPAHRLAGRLRRHSGRCLDGQQNARGGLPGRRVFAICADRHDRHRG